MKQAGEGKSFEIFSSTDTDAYWDRPLNMEAITFKDYFMKFYKLASFDEVSNENDSEIIDECDESVI